MTFFNIYFIISCHIVDLKQFTHRKSVSTSQLNTELEEETKNDQKKVKGKKIAKKTKKKRIFLNPQELLSKFKQEKLLKEFWTTTKDEEEYLRSRSSDND